LGVELAEHVSPLGRPYGLPGVGDVFWSFVHGDSTLNTSRPG
jgi:hypothetical protein